ncbi:MAG: hypothetical protein HQL54_03715 [Magnetococcales bacterium]|nr:hypothetical protein [Magnetococcales bacterium]
MILKKNAIRVILGMMLGLTILFPSRPVQAQTLWEAVSEAIYTNPEVLATHEDWGKVRNQIQEAFSNYLPAVNLARINLRDGDMVNWFWIDGVMEEMYDIVILPGIHSNLALGFKCDHIRELLDGEMPVGELSWSSNRALR